MIKIYGLKNCDTCRKALKDLIHSGAEATLVDIRQTPLEKPQLQAFLDLFGEALLNKRSTTWRGLSCETRARPAIELLAEYPALTKRPIIAAAQKITLGWDRAAKSIWLTDPAT